jgi:hypothetical protein
LNNLQRTILLLAFTAPGLAAGGIMPAEKITEPTPERYSVCFDHSCTSIVTDSLSQDEWRLVTAVLRNSAWTAADERLPLPSPLPSSRASSAGIPGRTATGAEISRFRTTRALDCIDESTNTTTYLRLLERGGLLRHHRVLERSTRFGLFVGMPHTTAVIEETGTGDRYAVDSWFLDNGRPPYIAKLEVWKGGAMMVRRLRGPTRQGMSRVAVDCPGRGLCGRCAAA